jgi:hypothetical protein
MNSECSMLKGSSDDVVDNESVYNSFNLYVCISYFNKQ